MTAGTPARNRYIASLCVIALAVLVAGVVLRPTTIPIPVRSESELYRLQLMAKQQDVQNETLFFESKARELVARSQTARATPATFPFHIPDVGKKMILVASHDSGQPVWAVTASAGMAKANCGDRAVEEIDTTIPIPATLANAVAFDLEGNFSGLVIACGDRRIVTTPEGLRILSEKTVRDRLAECCGLDYAIEGGAAEVNRIGEDSRLFKAGLRPGDRLLAVNGRAVALDSDLEPLLGSEDLQLSIDRPKKIRPLTIKVRAQ